MNLEMIMRDGVVVAARYSPNVFATYEPTNSLIRFWVNSYDEVYDCFETLDIDPSIREMDRIQHTAELHLVLHLIEVDKEIDS